jgi:hypothetical protein
MLFTCCTSTSNRHILEAYVCTESTEIVVILDMCKFKHNK